MTVWSLRACVSLEVKYIIRLVNGAIMYKTDITKIGIGTWMLGGDVAAAPDNDDENDINALRFAINHGINHIDTSESYSGGKSEILVGKAIRGFDRTRIFIATKVREWNLRYKDLIVSCHQSLERMNLSYIDLYYIHKQNPAVSVLEMCKALNYLLDKGLIKNVGLSNVGVDKIEEFNKYLNINVFAVQNQYNLVCRESQHKHVIDYCRNKNIKFICWRPIMLSYPGVVDPMYGKGTYPLLDNMAQKYKVSNVQIVAKWLLQQENVYIVFKSNKPDHIKEIIDTGSFELSEDDWQKLNMDFPVQFDKGCSTNEFFELS